MLGVKSNKPGRDEEMRRDEWELSGAVREEATARNDSEAPGSGIDHERN